MKKARITRLSTALVAIALAVGVASRAPVEAAVRDGDGRTRSTAGASCWGIKRAFPASRNGVYWLQTSLMPAPARFRCDMTRDGGGWVLVGRGRQGWTFDEAGQGTSRQVYLRATGIRAFEPAALSSATIDKLVGGRPIKSLTDGVRLIRATNAAGTRTQNVTWRLLDLTSWSWAFDGGHRLRSVTIDGRAVSGGNTRDSRELVWGEIGPGMRSANDLRRVATSAQTANGDVQGFALGSTMRGSPAADTNLWSGRVGGAAPIGFTQVWLKPRIANSPRTTIPNSGLPAWTIPAGMSPLNTPLQGGVTGVLKSGDSEPLIDVPVLAFAEFGDRIYVGGKFSNVQRGQGGPLVDQPYLAAFDRSTGAWIEGFRPVLNGTVWDLAVTPAGVLVAGGQFDSVNGQPREGLVALDPDTGVTKAGWPTTVRLTCTGNTSCADRAIVRALDVEGGWLYVGGNFSRITDQVKESNVARIVRVSVANGKLDRPGFRPNIEGTVFDIDATPSRVYAAGKFSVVNATTRESIATLDPADGQLIAGQRPMVQTTGDIDHHYQQAVLALGNQVWSAGSEHNVHIYRSSDFALQKSWLTARRGGDGQSLAVSGNTVFVGSHSNSHVFSDTTSYTNRAGYTRVEQSRWVSAFDAVTMTHQRDFVLDAQSRNSEGAWALQVDSTGCLWVGGDFRAGALVAGQRRYAEGFLKLCPTDSTAPSVPTDATLVSTARQRRITWGPSMDDSGTPVTYEVLHNDRVIAQVSGTSFIDKNIGAPARYFVRAVDRNGNRSATTTIASNDHVAPTVPGNVQVTALSNSSIRVSWSASTDNVRVTGYRVFVDGVKVAVTTNRIVDVKGLARGRRSVQVLAFDAAANVSPRTAPFYVDL